MKIRVLMAFAACWVALVAAYAESGRQAGVAGKWATDAVWDAKPERRTERTMESIFNSIRCAGGSIAPLIVIDGKVVQRGNPEALALTMEIKLDKTKLTGRITEVVSGDKFDIEGARVMGNRFEFITSRNLSKVKTTTVYMGELVDESTITLTRWTNSGKAADTKEVGTQETLIFRRGK